MKTIHITTQSRLSPETVLAAGYDFSARPAEILPAVAIPQFEVHELSQARLMSPKAHRSASASTGNVAATTGHSPGPSRLSSPTPMCADPRKSVPTIIAGSPASITNASLADGGMLLFRLPRLFMTM
jgi:hypothetical protein